MDMGSFWQRMQGNNQDGSQNPTGMAGGLAAMGNRMGQPMGPNPQGQPNAPGMPNGMSSLFGGLGKMAKGKLGKKMGMGTNPSAGSPNNPFGNVQFGSPMPPGGMGPQPTPGVMSPMAPPNPTAGVNPMQGGLWNIYQQNLQGQQPPGVNFPAMY